MRLSGKTAVITGVNSGIGREAARLFATEGADIAGVDIRTDRMEELGDEIREASARFCGFGCDIREYKEVKKIYSRVEELYGHIDIVLNIAGISTDYPVTRTSSEEYQRVMDTNVKGVFNFCKGAASYMKKQKHGILINTSSVTGIYGTGIGCPYPASKAAIIGMTKSLAIELAPWNIRVNAVAPGVVQTEMVASLDERAKKAFAETIPLKRLGKAGDVAAAMLFLASDDADYITGTVISVDGGYRPSTVNM